MATQPVEQRAPDDRTEQDIDKSIEDSFPASDAPATGGSNKNRKAGWERRAWLGAGRGCSR